MSLPDLSLAFGRKMRWRFDPEPDRYAGVLLVEIPVYFDTGIITGEHGFLKLRVELADHFDRAERRNHVFPRGLPLPEDWPFSYRVEMNETEPDFLEYNALAIALENAGYKGVNVHTNVTVRIFAMPGVQVTVEVSDASGAFSPFDPLEESSGPLTLKVAVERLCRPESMPVSGAPISNTTLYPGHPAQGCDSPLRDSVLSRFVVRHVPNGVDILWLATQQTVSLRLKRPQDHRSGFVYWFNPKPRFYEHGDFLDYEDLLHIVTLGEVEVVVTLPVPPELSGLGPRLLKVAEFLDRFLERKFFADPLAWERFVNTWQSTVGPIDTRTLPELLRRVEESRFFRLRQVDDAADLPPYGAPLAITPGEDRAADEYPAYIKPILSPGQVAAAQFVTDIAIGLIPVIGDLADYAEFNTALATGKNRWGDEVEDWELPLMAASAIPIVGDALKVVRRFAGLA